MEPNKKIFGVLVVLAITQVIGSTFDVQYPEGELPEIYNAVKVVADTAVGHLNLTGEVQQHLGGGRVRAVSLGSTPDINEAKSSTLPLAPHPKHWKMPRARLAENEGE